MSTRFRISLFCSFIGVALIAGCKSNSTGPNNPTVTVTRPGVGSTFILHDQAFDSSGHAVALYDEWDTIVVVSSGISYQGKSNVVSFKVDSHRAGTTSENVLYLNYEANGDILWFMPGWATIPIASQGTSSFPLQDTTYTDSTGQVQHRVLTDEYSYTGEDTVEEAGTSFDTRSFLFNQYFNGEAEPYPETQWWAPSIGFMVKYVSNLDESVWGGAVRFTKDLVSYTLK